MRVLVVDDDLSTVELMRMTLTAYGHSASSASNVADALTMVEMDSPRVILSDLTFSNSADPGNDGCALARSLRANPKHADVAMIAITGSTSPHELQAALDCGFNEIVTKPFDIASLIGRIGELGREDTQRPTAR